MKKTFEPSERRSISKTSVMEIDNDWFGNRVIMNEWNKFSLFETNVGTT